MSDDGVYANFEALEGTVTEETTLTLARRSRKIVIINDHAALDLTYKFNSSETVGTLKGTESLSVYLRTNQIIINGKTVTKFCPKLILLQRYPYVGPAKSIDGFTYK